MEVNFTRSSCSCHVLTKAKLSTEHTTPAAFQIVLLTWGILPTFQVKVDTSRVLKCFPSDRMVGKVQG